MASVYKKKMVSSINGIKKTGPFSYTIYKSKLKMVSRQTYDLKL